MPKKIQASEPITRAILSSDMKREFAAFEKRFEKKMEAMIDRKLDQKLEEKLEEKLEQKLEEKFEKYVSKLYNLIDTVLMETKDRRDEYDTNVGSIPSMKEEIHELQDRVEKIELRFA